MRKVVFFTDVHLSMTPPSKRTESYYEDVLKKLEYVFTTYKDDIVIFGGDLFHSKVLTKISFRMLEDIFTFFKQAYKCYVVPGNHDIYNEMSLKGRPLGLLQHLSNVFVCHNEVVYDEDLGVHLAFFGGGDFLDKKELAKFTVSMKGVKGRKWGVYHSSLALPNRKYPFSTLNAAKILNYGGYEFLFLGHLHDQQGIDGGVIAPGALSRGTFWADERLWRPIKIAVVEGSQVSLVEIPYRPADEVFIIEEVEEEVREKELISEVVDAISAINVRVVQNLSKADIMKMVSSLDIDGRVKKEALRILEGL